MLKVIINGYSGTMGKVLTKCVNEDKDLKLVCGASKDILDVPFKTYHKMSEVEKYIKSIPDFPQPGIIFRDVTSVTEDPEGMRLAIDEMDKLLDGVDYDVIAGAESRGFIFGAPLAYKNGKGLVLVRKKGKLPRETVEMSYDLEYGQATIEIHKDSIRPGEKVVLVDDLIATGGTIEAAAKLIESLGGIVVKMVFLIELTDLKGRERLSKYDVASVVQFEGE